MISNLLKTLLILGTFLITSSCSESEFNSNSVGVDKKSGASEDALGGINRGGEDLPAEHDKNGNGIADFLEDNNGDGIPDGYVDTDGDGIPDALPEDLKKIASPTIDGLATVSDCDIAKAKGYLATASTMITYKDNRDEEKVCDWDGEDGGRVHGKESWDKTLNFPDSYVVCKMEINSPKSKFYYDDGLMLTLNNKALLWGSVQATKLKLEDGFRVYSWDDIYKSELGSEHSGCLDGATSCEVPETQKEGSLSLSFNDDVNMKLMKEIEDKGAVLTLHGFGDNDDDIDCTHSELNLEIKYQYFAK